MAVTVTTSSEVLLTSPTPCHQSPGRLANEVLEDYVSRCAEYRSRLIPAGSDRGIGYRDADLGPCWVMAAGSGPRRPRSGWESAARLGQTAWYYGNLYETVVGMPQLLLEARAERAPSLLGPGSPVRYYVGVAPLALGATTVSLVASWRSGEDRRLIVVTAGSIAVAVLLSAHLIRSVNVPLLISHESLGERDERRLVRTWHGVNAVRLVALAGARIALERLGKARPA